MLSVAERFWAKVAKSDGCWLWTGARLRHGYGQFTRATKQQVSAHRLAWELSVGPIPDGMCVLHSCDVPACVRPDHLFLGTQLDNVADRHRKGRTVRGERNGRGRLTPEQVRVIRARLARGEGATEIARAFEMHPATIQCIKERRSWRHLV